MNTLSGLYAITDGQLRNSELLAAVEAVLQGGGRILQYRNKQADVAVQLAEARDLLALCHQYGALLLINDNAPLAAAAGADGVHLGQEDMSVMQARGLLGKEAIIGITCHNSLALALAAQDAGADYVAFGRFFPSGTKPSAPPASLTVLQDAKAQLHIPVVAIGGITLDNASTVLEAGADMLAVVGDLFNAPDITHRARAYCELFKNKGKH